MDGPFDPSAPLLPDPPALEAPSAAAGVCSGASRVSSIGFSAVLYWANWQLGFRSTQLQGTRGLID